MAFNSNRLKSEMARYGVTSQEISNAMGIKRNSYYRKLRTGIWTLEEMQSVLMVLQAEAKKNREKRDDLTIDYLFGGH